MYKLVIITCFIILSACATTTPPLRDVHYIADGWVVAAFDDKAKIYVHAKELPIFSKDMSKKDVWTEPFIVGVGDTLTSISYVMYGTYDFAEVIAFTNDIDNVNIIHVGEILNIPFVLTVEEASVDLKQWDVRFVNSNTVAQCINVTFLNMDVSIQIEDGWYLLEPSSTLYVGLIEQEYWDLENESITLDDAAWAVDVIETVAFSEENGCAFD